MNQIVKIAGFEVPTGNVHDFDFLHGSWSVANWRLKQRWASSEQWDKFTGIARCEPRLGQLANVEEICFPSLGLSGLTLRVFDRAAMRWSIYWASSEGARLFPPVSGGFVGDFGLFFGEDEDQGTPIRVRYLWEKQGPVHARWSQAFSRDGVEWETNWVMELTRRV